MTQVSSSMTYLYKRIWPTFWFGICGLLFSRAVYLAIFTNQPMTILPFILFPFMALFGYFAMRMNNIFRLVDEVWDCGDSVLVINRQYEWRFELHEIRYLYSERVDQASLLLRDRDPDLGAEVIFLPVQRLIPFLTHPALRELKDRIAAAQSAATDQH